MRRRRVWLFALLHCAALAPVLAATPGAPQLAREIASILQADDCCAHACESSECCPGDCLDCRYCAHANAITPALFALSLASQAGVARTSVATDLHSYAYVSPPARPPAG